MLETGQSLSARSAVTMLIPATLLCRGEQEKEGRQEEGKEGAMEDYPCTRLTMGEVSHKLGTVSTYLGLRLSLSMPIFVLSYNRLLSAFDSVQVNNLNTVEDLGQVGSVLTSYRLQQCCLNNLPMGSRYNQAPDCSGESYPKPTWYWRQLNPSSRRQSLSLFTSSSDFLG